MRQFKILYVLFILALPSFAEAKTDVSVAQFADKSEKGRCPSQAAKMKTEIDKELREKLIAGLLELKRFQIQEREIRNLKLEHQIVGTVRSFEICAANGRPPQAKIEIEVQMRSPSGGLTHMFSSHAAISSPAPNRAMQLAMNHVINDVLKGIDEAVPRREATLKLRSAREVSSANPMRIRMMRRTASRK